VSCAASEQGALKPDTAFEETQCCSLCFTAKNQPGAVTVQIYRGQLVWVNPTTPAEGELDV